MKAYNDNIDYMFIDNKLIEPIRGGRMMKRFTGKIYDMDDFLKKFKKVGGKLDSDLAVIVAKKSDNITGDDMAKIFKKIYGADKGSELAKFRDRDFGKSLMEEIKNKLEGTLSDIFSDDDDDLLRNLQKKIGRVQFQDDIDFKNIYGDVNYSNNLDFKDGVNVIKNNQEFKLKLDGTLWKDGTKIESSGIDVAKRKRALKNDLLNKKYIIDPMDDNKIIKIEDYNQQVGKRYNPNTGEEWKVGDVDSNIAKTQKDITKINENKYKKFVDPDTGDKIDDIDAYNKHLVKKNQFIDPSTGKKIDDIDKYNSILRKNTDRPVLISKKEGKLKSEAEVDKEIGHFRSTKKRLNKMREGLKERWRAFRKWNNETPFPTKLKYGGVIIFALGAVSLIAYGVFKKEEKAKKLCKNEYITLDDGKRIKDYLTKDVGNYGCRGLSNPPDVNGELCRDKAINCIDNHCNCQCNNKDLKCPGGYECGSRPKAGNSIRTCREQCTGDDECSGSQKCFKQQGVCYAFCGSDNQCGLGERCKTMEEWCPPKDSRNFTIDDETSNVDRALKNPDDNLHQIYNYKLFVINFIFDNYKEPLEIFGSNGFVILKDKDNKVVPYTTEKKDKLLEIDYVNKYDINLGSDILQDEDLRKIYLELIVNVIYIITSDELNEFVNLKGGNKEIAFINIKARLYYKKIYDNFNNDEKQEIKKIFGGDEIEEFNNYIESFASGTPTRSGNGCFKNWKTCVKGERCNICPFSFIPLIGDDMCFPCIFEEKNSVFNSMFYIGIFVVIVILLIILFKSVF